MNLLNINEEETNVNLPKHVETTFILRNNFYVVTNGEIFNYYPIKVAPSEDISPLIRLERTPPVLLEGYAIVGKKIYIVPLQDLQRKIIRKSREIKRETQNASDTSTDSNTEQPSATTLINTLRASALSAFDESGISEASELEIAKAAHATWEDQVGALYGNPFEEENDWEVEGNS